MSILCSYGCGLEANYVLKNGKPCCSPHSNSCPELKKRNSEGIRKRLETSGPWGFGGKNGGGWNKGLTKETSDVLRTQADRIHQRYESGSLIPSFKGKHHSEESKRKTSASRKKYLEEHPEKAPYLLNHYSKGPSYPEIYWIDLIRNENLDLSYHKQIGLYELDFFNEDKKIDLEIDGEQHYSDNRIVESDRRRTLYLESLGWKIIRVRWSEWQKKIEKDKLCFIEELRDIIR